MNSLQQLLSISKLLGSGNHQKSDVYAHCNHSFRNLWDSSNHYSIFIRLFNLLLTRSEKGKSLTRTTTRLHFALFFRAFSTSSAILSSSSREMRDPSLPSSAATTFCVDPSKKVSTMCLNADC